MQNLIFYSPFEYHYSQADDKTLVIGALFYSEIEKKIIFECDKTKAKSILHTHYPKIKFEIIEAYIDLIYQKIEKNPSESIYNEIDFKKHIDNFIFSPDDSALRFGKIKALTNTKNIQTL